MSCFKSGNAVAKGAKRQKQPFCFDDDDDDGPVEGGVRPAIATQAEPDIFDESIEDMIEESRRDIHGSGKAATSSYHGNSEMDDLFVFSDERVQNAELSHEAAVPIKSEESDDDFDLMIIDQGEASSKAREEWSKPRGPWTIDLTPSSMVKTEPVEHTRLSPVLEATGREPATEVSVLGITSSQHEESAIKRLEERQAKLHSRALNGAITREEISEMYLVSLELGQAREAAKAENNASKAAPFLSSNLGERTAGESKKKAKRKPSALIKTHEKLWRHEGQKRLDREKKDDDRKAHGKKRPGACQGTARDVKRMKKSDQTLKDAGEEGVDTGIQRQINKILRTVDAIQERADAGKLPDAPVIIATTRAEQLKQLRDAAPGYFDPELLRDQARQLLQATKGLGPRAVRAKNGLWDVKGMLSDMHNHQLVVGAWMRNRELNTVPKMPKGGILADAMGLGKTIETLSCIVRNQASEKLQDEGKGPTLVVAPSGQTISQWMDEVRKHCNRKFARHIIHFKEKDKMDVDPLAYFNIVFASYHQLRRSIPCVETMEQKRKEIADPKKYKKWLEESTGVLHRIEWHRVVLDEAHAIKNHQTHSAYASFRLKAKYRWAVTGTPLINADSEFFSYLKFIECHGIQEFRDFERKFRAGTPTREKYDKLIDDVMMRRTQGEYFLGQPILNLPTTKPTHQYLKLSKEEMVIFKMIEGCFRRKINRDIEKGTAAIQMKSYLVMLLRLRQASTHPFLLEGMMAKYFTQRDLEATRKQLNDLKGGSTVYNQIGSWTQRQRIGNRRLIEEPSLLNNPQLVNGTEELLDTHITQTDESVHCEATNQGLSQLNGGEGAVEIFDDTDEVDSQDEAEEDEDGLVPERYLSQRTQPGHVEGMDVNTEDSQLQPFGHSDFGLAFDMSKQIQYLEKVLEMKRSKCASCHQRSPLNPVKGSKCGCVFCPKCVVDHLADNGRKCPRCRREIGRPNKLKPFDDEEDGNAGSTTQTLNDKEYAKGFDYTGFQHTEDDKDEKHAVRFLQVADRHPNLPLTPSAKLTALKETVLRWQAEAPDDKIIIFSQFNVVMKLIGRLLEAEKIDFAYLSGKQNTEQRNRAVDEFQNGDKIKVLIVSLRAGGQCLNLTKANRVILMELWWNHGVEQQAFARVYRIGQIKETHFVRFIVDTPIEQRMLQMQASKIHAIDAALQDDTIRAPKLSLEDIGNLLGKITFRNGAIHHVSADYDDANDNYDDYDDSSDDSSYDSSEEEGDLEGFVVSDDEEEATDSLSDESEEE
ncbi:SNF2 family domain-containing protein [Colletotrichum melonis]|uniref:SNF2 family domain-containing protein n=1 Tax=Colletotrichum melonis TaxID=1209925 RepID=A0AAI9XH17_9PEZI|nr:SNF2 family domain-containing protein [Colletotrichum melonis]